MKYLLPLALLSLVLSGCSENPLKQASIEDRAVSTASDKSAADSAQNTPPATDMSSAAVAQDSAAKGTSANGVETRGVVLQSPEAKSLSGSGDKTDAAAQKGADGADGLKFVAQPVLDPKDPQSPLAQRRILFDYDSAAIRDEYRTLLEMHAQYLKKEKAAKMILQGHADDRGSREYNLALGQRRSESVFKALNLLGVPDTQMEAVSLGEEKPVSEAQDETGWAQNRRAELLYQGE